MKKLFAAVLAFAFAPSLLSAQETDILTITQWVRPSVAGEFKARMVAPELGGSARAVENVVVTLRGHDGLYFRGVSNETGEVVITDVPPGPYIMLAHTRGLTACYTMHVIGREQPGEGLYAKAIEVPLAEISLKRFYDTIRPYMTGDYDINAIEIDENNIEKIIRHVRGNEAYRVNHKSNVYVGFLYQSGDHGVAYDDEDVDDRLDPHEGAHVFLHQGTKRIGRDLTSRSGRFEFSEIDAGVYGLIAAGPHGFGVVGFELSDPPADTDQAQHSINGFRYVNRQAESGSDFAMQTAPVTNAQMNTEVTGGPGGAIAGTVPAGAGAAGGGGAGAAGGAAGAGGGGAAGGAAGGAGGGIGAAAAIGGAAAASGGGSGGGFTPPQAASPTTVGP